MRRLVSSVTLLIFIVAGGWWLYSRSDAAQGLMAASQDQHVTAIQHYTRAINSGTLSQQYLAVMYRYRGASYAALGDHKRALTDQEKAGELTLDDSVLKVAPAAGAKPR